MRHRIDYVHYVQQKLSPIQMYSFNGLTFFEAAKMTKPLRNTRNQRTEAKINRDKIV